MRETGIVRRIDELGRVVIPKEIRKTLRIKEGDPLEIYMDKDELFFKKYSPLSSVSEYGKTVADSIQDLTEKTCIITDTDTILYASNGKHKEIIGKTLSADMDRVLKERKSVVSCRAEGGNVLPLYRGDDMGIENQIIVPIIVGGDCFGGVVLVDKQPSTCFDPETLKLVRLGATFLSKSFE
ncbi:MAG: AbrB/MazE/SpoVT family DNA-binding domain-containing protein [Clostridiales bacterium]|nr:AbrB/MazE/SpoVT family DNA-binding domain-containing protein [Clostridiales bacterium]